MSKMNEFQAKWADNEIEELLASVKARNLLAISNGKKRKSLDIFSSVVEDLRKKEILRTEEQIRKKLNELRRQYFHAKDVEPDERYGVCKHYDKMHDLFQDAQRKLNAERQRVQKVDGEQNNANEADHAGEAQKAKEAQKTKEEHNGKEEQKAREHQVPEKANKTQTNNSARSPRARVKRKRRARRTSDESSLSTYYKPPKPSQSYRSVSVSSSSSDSVRGKQQNGFDQYSAKGEAKDDRKMNGAKRTVGSPVRVISDKFHLRQLKFQPNLMNAIANMCKNDRYADVVLLVYNKEECIGIPAHKFMLATISTYFANVFDKLAVVPSTSIMYVMLPPMVTRTAIQTILHFMYNGEVTISKDVYDDVMACGELLGLHGFSVKKGDSMMCQKDSLVSVPLVSVTKTLYMDTSPPSDARHVSPAPKPTTTHGSPPARTYYRSPSPPRKLARRYEPPQAIFQQPQQTQPVQLQQPSQEPLQPQQQQQPQLQQQPPIQQHVLQTQQPLQPLQPPPSQQPIQTYQTPASTQQMMPQRQPVFQDSTLVEQPQMQAFQTPQQQQILSQRQQLYADQNLDMFGAAIQRPSLQYTQRPGSIQQEQLQQRQFQQYPQQDLYADELLQPMPLQPQPLPRQPPPQITQQQQIPRQPPLIRPQRQPLPLPQRQCYPPQQQLDDERPQEQQTQQFFPQQTRVQQALQQSNATLQRQINQLQQQQQQQQQLPEELMVPSEPVPAEPATRTRPMVQPQRQQRQPRPLPPPPPRQIQQVQRQHPQPLNRTQQSKPVQQLVSEVSERPDPIEMFRTQQLLALPSTRKQSPAQQLLQEADLQHPRALKESDELLQPPKKVDSLPPLLPPPPPPTVAKLSQQEAKPPQQHRPKEQQQLQVLRQKQQQLIQQKLEQREKQLQQKQQLLQRQKQQLQQMQQQQQRQLLKPPMKQHPLQPKVTKPKENGQVEANDVVMSVNDETIVPPALSLFGCSKGSEDAIAADVPEVMEIAKEIDKSLTGSIDFLDKSRRASIFEEYEDHRRLKLLEGIDQLNKEIIKEYEEQMRGSQGLDEASTGPPPVKPKAGPNASVSSSSSFSTSSNSSTTSSTASSASSSSGAQQKPTVPEPDIIDALDNMVTLTSDESMMEIVTKSPGSPGTSHFSTASHSPDSQAKIDAMIEFDYGDDLNLTNTSIHDEAHQVELEGDSGDHQEGGTPLDQLVCSRLNCQLCYESFTTPPDWVQHVSGHCIMDQGLLKRRRVSNDDDNDIDSAFRCDMCSSYFISAQDWQTHVSDAHENV